MWHLSVLFQVGFLAIFFQQPCSLGMVSSLKMAWLSVHVCQTANLWNHSNTGTIAWENLKMIWISYKNCTYYVIMFIHTFTNMLLSTLLLVRKVHSIDIFGGHHPCRIPTWVEAGRWGEVIPCLGCTGLAFKDVPWPASCMALASPVTKVSDQPFRMGPPPYKSGPRNHQL